MKNIVFITFLSVITISANTHAWFLFPFDDLEFSNRSGSFYRAEDSQPPQLLKIVKGHDLSNYYVYIELEGIKTEEVDFIFSLKKNL